jgi:gamma-glutamyltranspeptidase/glutathione hydrolase
MAFGNMGGGTQPQAHAQHVINMVDHGMNVQMTTDAARFDHSQGSDRVSLDQYLFEAIGADLMARGHAVASSRGLGGGFQGIYFEAGPPESGSRGRDDHDDDDHGDMGDRPINGVYRAGSDSRKDGHAAGW